MVLNGFEEGTRYIVYWYTSRRRYMIGIENFPSICGNFGPHWTDFNNSLQWPRLFFSLKYFSYLDFIFLSEYSRFLPFMLHILIKQLKTSLLQLSTGHGNIDGNFTARCNKLDAFANWVIFLGCKTNGFFKNRLTISNRFRENNSFGFEVILQFAEY